MATPKTAPSKTGIAKTVKPVYKFKEDSINCPACTKPFDQPRILPCLHSFCHNCLVKSIQDGHFDASAKGFPCPCCRKLATTPDIAKARPEKWAELFPINSLLADVVDLYSLKKGTRLCDPCKKNKSKSQVHSYCKNCRDALCENCSKTHRGLRSCKHHKVLTTAQFEAAISSLKVEDEFCSKHDGKTMEYYCQTHSKLCCPSCVSEEHRQCDKVVPVLEAAQKCREAHDAAKLENALHKYKAHMDLVLKNRSTQLKKLEGKKGKLMDEFMNVKKHIISQLEKMEKDMKTKLDQTHRQETRKIQGEVKKCQELQSGVINAGELLEIAENHGSNSQVIDTVEKVRNECGYYEENVDAITKKAKTVDYDIAVDKSVEQMMKKLNQFGRIDVKSTPSGLPPTPKIAGTLGLQSLTTKTDSVKPALALTGKEANEIGAFNGRDSNDAEDQTCWFTGAQYLKDGRIMLADRTNKKLKLFKSNFNLEAELLLSSRPWDVTAISDTEIAVSLPEESHNGQIIFVSISKKNMVTTRGFYTDEPCYGIHYVNNKILGVAYDGDPPSLKVMSLEGEELTYVSVDEDGFTLFSKPIYVTSNDSGTEIFVTDERLGCVVNLTEKGELHFTYSAMDLGHAAGIATDNEGNIYVCGNTSNSVHVVSPTGNRVKVLVTGESISYPRAIAYEPKEKKLLVTQGDKDDVKVYSLAPDSST